MKRFLIYMLFVVMAILPTFLFFSFVSLWLLVYGALNSPKHMQEPEIRG